MNLWDFLNWLYGQILRVVSWFGSYWDYAVQVIFSIVNTAIEYANNAYTNAVNWAKSQVEIAYANALYYIDVAKRAAQDLFNSVRNLAYDLYNVLVGTINGVKNWVSSQVTSLMAWTMAQINLAIYNEHGSITAWVNSLFSTLLGPFKPLLALVDKVSSILSILEQDIYDTLLNLIKNLSGTLSAIVQSPIAFTYGVIWDTFTTFLAFVLAYALGTVEQTLPPRPDWGQPGGTIPGQPPPAIPPGAGTLTRPVSPLYVSGYTFGPNHKGTDFGVTMGQTVYAAHTGTVTYAAWDTSGYGNRIDISGESYWTRYGHLQGFYVKPGQQVTRGQAIGLGDSTGNSTGPHLHFELKISGSYVNPVLYL